MEEAGKGVRPMGQGLRQITSVRIDCLLLNFLLINLMFSQVSHSGESINIIWHSYWSQTDLTAVHYFKNAVQVTRACFAESAVKPFISLVLCFCSVFASSLFCQNRLLTYIYSSLWEAIISLWPNVQSWNVYPIQANRLHVMLVGPINDREGSDRHYFMLEGPINDRAGPDRHYVMLVGPINDREAQTDTTSC